MSHKLLRWLIPALLITLLISNLALILEAEAAVYLYLFGVQLLFYFLAFIGFAFGGEMKRWIIDIPFYFCLVNGAAFYGLYKGLLNKQPVTWKKFSRK